MYDRPWWDSSYVKGPPHGKCSMGSMCITVVIIPQEARTGSVSFISTRSACMGQDFKDGWDIVISGKIGTREGAIQNQGSIDAFARRTTDYGRGCRRL